MMTACLIALLLLCVLMAAHMVFGRRRALLVDRAVRGIEQSLGLMGRTLNTVVELKREHIEATGKLFVRGHDQLGGMQTLANQATDNMLILLDALDAKREIKTPKIERTKIEPKPKPDEPPAPAPGGPTP